MVDVAISLPPQKQDANFSTSMGPSQRNHSLCVPWNSEIWCCANSIDQSRSMVGSLSRLSRWSFTLFRKHDLRWSQNDAIWVSLNSVGRCSSLGRRGLLPGALQHWCLGESGIGNDLIPFLHPLRLRYTEYAEGQLQSLELLSPDFQQAAQAHDCVRRLLGAVDGDGFQPLGWESISRNQGLNLCMEVSLILTPLVGLVVYLVPLLFI